MQIILVILLRKIVLDTMKKQTQTLSKPLMLALLLKQYLPECLDTDIFVLTQNIHNVQCDVSYEEEPFPLHLDVLFQLKTANVSRLVYIKVCETYRFEKEITYIKERGVAMQMYAMYQKQPVCGIWLFTDPPINDAENVMIQVLYMPLLSNYAGDNIMIHIPIKQVTKQEDFTMFVLYQIFHGTKDVETLIMQHCSWH